MIVLIASAIISISLILIIFKIIPIIDNRIKYNNILKDKRTMNIDGYMFSIREAGWSYCQVEIYKDGKMIYVSRKSELIDLKTHGKKEEIRKFYLEALEEYKEYKESWSK